MTTNKLSKRFALAAAFFTLIAILLVVGVIYVPSRLGKPASEIVSDIKDEKSVRGGFFDSNMNPVVYRDENGRRVISDGSSWGSVLGYNSAIYGKSGLEEAFNSILTTSSTRDKRCDSVVLTMDRDVQSKLSELLSGYAEGSAGVLMDANTGEIVAMTSGPSFDPGNIDSQFDGLSRTAGMFSNKATSSYTPGSVMKLVSAVALIRGGMALDIYDDPGETTIDGARIVNFGSVSHGRVDLVEALGYSINCYFAVKTAYLGEKAFRETLDDFLVGRNIALDFTVLHSSYAIDSPAELAWTACGQGRMTISPLHMTMISAAIANKGTLVAPNVCLGVVDADGNFVDKAKRRDLGVVLSEEECRILSEGMVLSAGNAGLLPGVYAKTGTAETGSAGSNNIWMTGYFDSRDTSYAFCVMAPGADATGSSLGSVVNELAKFMN